MKFRLFVAALCLLLPRIIVHGLTDSEWEKGKNDQGIKILYRKIRSGDTINTREMKIEFEIESNTKNIIKFLNNKKRMLSWNLGVRDCKIFLINQSEWVVYTRYKIPRPLTQQDIITNFVLKTYPDSLFIELTSNPDYLTEVDGVNRQQKYIGSWTFIPIALNKTKVVFRAITFTKPLVPRFIQDPIIQRMMIKSFVKLRELTEAEK